ncbi:adaptin N terminal region-domain-containing protein [Ochromonadaceae sp. CCMP2298]|nr:adaptin N terminal region-domain-containing protein [Ochromonadaceae sp. CCMP2298]
MNRDKKGTGADSKFFTSKGSKGENHELREELRSPQRDRKRDAVKKVIANMTIGKDVSSLFADVINCIQTEDLELKKLVYLYLINYAKSQPDLALLAVNTFVKDANDPNPLIRALSIRTMGCIRVDKITEYLCEPLAKCLKDEDPYVRKTAAVCVAKLYDISPELVEDRGFVDCLRDLISDANPTVVANAVSALSEIAEASNKDVMMVTANVLQKLLAALNECTEWGQVFILDSLSAYEPQDSREAEGIIERVMPRLQHNNSAVVMSAVKVILRYVDDVTNQEVVRNVSKKLAPPLVTLLNAEPEIQFVALRNISLVVLKQPRILEHEIKVFFCKYNDPIYVKMEKLEIIIRLASDRNVEQVLLELKEYATEVDVEFVRRSVRAIGRCAIKLSGATERCINVLLDLIKTKVSYVVQEAVVVIKDIFRKYPNRYESVIGTLCENLEDLDEPEAKASMVWIIGEYADRIDNADELLESFLETFQEETAMVQLQLLTATVKLFLKQPDNTQEMVQRVLNLATEHSDNPDLRDRGYVYWRLLSSDPEAARAVVLSQKPEIGDDTSALDPLLLDELIGQIATLSSVYHKPADSFVVKTLHVVEEEEEDEEEEEGVAGVAYDSSGAAQTPYSSGGGNLLDLLDDDEPVPAPAPTAAAPSSALKIKLVGAEAGHGVAIMGAMLKKGGQIVLEMDITNTTPTPVSGLAIQLNKNVLGLAPSNPQLTFAPVANGSTSTAALVLVATPQMHNPQDASGGIQAAIKNAATGTVFYFTLPIALESCLAPGAGMEVGAFGGAWKGMDESMEVSALASDLPTVDIEAVKAKLGAKDIAFVLKRDLPDGQQTAVYFSAKTVTNSALLVELKFKAGMNVCKVTVKSANKALSELCKVAVVKLLT